MVMVAPKPCCEFFAAYSDGTFARQFLEGMQRDGKFFATVCDRHAALGKAVIESLTQTYGTAYLDALDGLANHEIYGDPDRPEPRGLLDSA